MRINREIRRLRKAFWTCMVLLVMTAIFMFSSQGSEKSEEVSDAFAEFLRLEQMEEDVSISHQPVLLGFTIRKLAHIFVYFVLNFCMFHALEGWSRRPLFSVVFSYLYAVFDEFHQSLVGRYGRWQDTLIDFIGIALGLALALLLPALRRILRERISAHKT